MTPVGATDTIPVPPTGKVVVVVQNLGGSVDNIVVTDPTSGVGPPGSSTPLVPNVALSCAATTGVRHFELDCQRFRDVNGNITLTHSFQTSVTCIVYGPYTG
jgi:hypothetical protein